MPKKNRSYKRGEPFRDATFMIIACEGAKREKVYFEAIANRNQRIKIKVLSPSIDVGHSAPNWILERAVSYVEEIGATEYDSLWFVLDVDKWRRSSLNIINSECKENWSIALSNPCFEIWLMMHYLEPNEINASTSGLIKRELNAKIKGGYNVETALKNIDDAIRRAKRVDNPDFYIPPIKATKVYKVVEQMKMK